KDLDVGPADVNNQNVHGQLRDVVALLVSPEDSGARTGHSQFSRSRPAAAAGTMFDRFELSVSVRSHSKLGDASISSVHRQPQLPPGRPGTFIRAALPRLSRSCNGAIARAAGDDHASLTSALAVVSPVVFSPFKWPHSTCRW